MAREGRRGNPKDERFLDPAETREATRQQLENDSLRIPEPPTSSRRNVERQRTPLSSAPSLSSLEEDEAASDAFSDLSREDSAAPNPFLGRAELGDQVEQLQRQLEDVQDQLFQAKTELALEQSRRPVQFDDQYFRDRVTNLRYSIRQWAKTHFTHTGGYITQFAKARFGGLSSEWAAYLDDGTLRPLLIQARLWQMLDRLVFDTYSEKRSGYLFAGKSGNGSLEKTLAQVARSGSDTSRRAYREWRIATYTLLFPGKGQEIEPSIHMGDEIEARTRKLRNKVWKSLSRYADRSSVNEHRHFAPKDLKDIIRHAIYLDLDMKKHNLDLSLSFQQGIVGPAFDAAIMEEAVNRSAGRYVGLVISPPLYKELELPNGGSEPRMLLKAKVYSAAVSRPPQGNVQKVIETLYTKPRVESKPPLYGASARGLVRRQRSTDHATRAPRQSSESLRSSSRAQRNTNQARY